MRVCLSLAAACAVAMSVSSYAASFTVGPNPTVGSTLYGFDLSQDPYAPSETAWFMGGAGNPLNVSYSPSAGAMELQLTGAGSLDPAQEVNLIQYLQVSGATWNSWQMSSLTPDFVWGTDAEDTFYTINGGAPQYGGVSYSPDHTTANIAFPSGLAAGTDVVLHGELEYSGASTFDNTVIPLVVHETVPEPSSLALLGLAGALALLRFRRGK